MKILARPVWMVAKFSPGKPPIPCKFLWPQEDGSRLEIHVDRVLFSEPRTFAGIDSIVYRCQSVIAGELRPYELKYVIRQYRWELYKM